MMASSRIRINETDSMFSEERYKEYTMKELIELSRKNDFQG